MNKLFVHATSQRTQARTEIFADTPRVATEIINAFNTGVESVTVLLTFPNELGGVKLPTVALVFETQVNALIAVLDFQLISSLNFEGSYFKIDATCYGKTVYTRKKPA